MFARTTFGNTLTAILLAIAASVMPCRAATNAAQAPGQFKEALAEEGDKNQPALPAVPVGSNFGTLVRWYGHAFIYLVARTGVRVACDPFNPDALPWAFPERLPADFVLISNESEAHAAGERIGGAPQVFRSTAAVGTNRANNIVFKGVATPRDETADAVTNTVFACTLDGIRFVHLGLLGQPLTTRQKDEIGQADVVFAPVGYRKLTSPQWVETARSLGARVLVPTVYDTPQAPMPGLRTAEEFLREAHLPTERFPINEVVLSSDHLPAMLTVYLLKPPATKKGMDAEPVKTASAADAGTVSATP